LQVVIAACKIPGVDAMAVLTAVLSACGDDKLIPAIVWQNLHPLLEDQGDRFLRLMEKADLKSAALGQLMPRVIERILGSKKPNPGVVVALFGLLAGDKTGNQVGARQCLSILAAKIQSGEVAGEGLIALSEKLQPTIRKLAGEPGHPLCLDACLLACTLKDPIGFDRT